MPSGHHSNQRGPGPGSRVTVGDLQANGPRLYRYPSGVYVIQHLGRNKRNRLCMLAMKLGKWSEEAAAQAFEMFKQKTAAAPAQLPAVIAEKPKRGRPAGNGHAQALPRVPADTTKAVLGLVATHLLNTLAHTVKLLQDADAEG